jgi:hypothetical protein
MLTQHHKPVSLSLLSFDLPVWSLVETNATVYQRAQDRFHVLLTEPLIQDFQSSRESDRPLGMTPPPTPRLLWLEISPYRVTLTMQGNGRFSYRHFWEQGVYGLSRFWLQPASFGSNEQIRLRNFTRSLELSGDPMPDHLRIEYELWTHHVQLGHYVMNLEIHH